MQLEDMVCSLEQAKELAELNVRCQTVFKWTEYENTTDAEVKRHASVFPIQISVTKGRPWIKSFRNLPAFSATELGLMLPDKSDIFWSADFRTGNIRFVHTELEHVVHSAWKTEAEARAALLIDMLKNDQTSAEECLARLQSDSTMKCNSHESNLPGYRRCSQYSQRLDSQI